MLTNHINEPAIKDGSLMFLFGATGDLARRKLFPAIYSLHREGKLSERFAVIGLARRPRTNEQFRSDVLQSIQEFCRYKIEDDDNWQQFVKHFEYMSLDIHNVEGFKQLDVMAGRLENEFQVPGNRLYYLSLAPENFGEVAHNLRDGGLLESKGWHRLVIEKPFGYDLESAQKLNEQLTQVFDETQIYRIDHYLGKEMVQNIEFIRFANSFLEPLWNHRHIANVQITLSETVGVEGRGGYYDKSGALRDMAQNHMLQILAMLAMEPPSRLLPEDIRDEKVKALRSLRSYNSAQEVKANVVRGQYGQGTMNDKYVPAYREEESVNPLSTTDTFFAARVYVDNFRWSGVPFYVRTGKRMPVKTTEVIVEFKNMADNVYFAQKHKLEPNLLVFRIHPEEGVYLRLNAKKPGSETAIIPVALNYNQNEAGQSSPEAYELLLHDAIRGDSTYFTRWDEVSAAWSFIDRIAKAWSEDAGDIQEYAAGSTGPERSAQMLAENGFEWWPIYGQNKE
jgi:glucose-6-phosphate 1-dehydrogenase